METRGRGTFGITVFPQVISLHGVLRKYLNCIAEILKGQAMPYKPTGRRVGRPEKEDAFKPVSVKLPPDLLERVKQYAAILRIPRISATQSTGMLPLSPEDFCHPVHGNVATLGA
jgi:hypothetical protein